MSDYVKNRLAELKPRRDLKMRALVSFKHVRKEQTRHGKTIYYYRKGKGRRIRLPDPTKVDAPTFNQAYVSAMREASSKPSARNVYETYSDTGGDVGSVYFLRMGDLVKIGFSQNYGERIKTLKTSCPEPTELLKLVPGTNLTEQFFHDHFAAYRQIREWFRLEGDLAAFCCPSPLVDISQERRV